MSVDEKMVGNSILSVPQYFLPASTASANLAQYATYAPEHWRLLQQIVPDRASVRPIMFITILPSKEVTQGTSEFNNVAHQRYNQIEHDLTEIGATPIEAGGVEEGAVGTAKALVQQMRRGELAPPELSWIGSEAIIMLWAIGDKRLALTITDGEYAYTARRNRETIGRASGLKPENFDLLRLK